MSVQFTVRLSDQSAAFIDHLVLEGKESSRASAIDRMVRRQQRRLEAEEDLKRYAEMPETDAERELRDAMAASAAKVWTDLD